MNNDRNQLIPVLNNKNIPVAVLPDNFDTNQKNELHMECDHEQINRALFNIIKNSIESINEKQSKNVDFTGLIDIEIVSRRDYLLILIKDNGIGLLNLNKKDLLKPYYTTKKNGSGLGLSIVNKIILDHNGSLKLSNTTTGAKIELFFSI